MVEGLVNRSITAWTSANLTATLTTRDHSQQQSVPNNVTTTVMNKIPPVKTNALVIATSPDKAWAPLVTTRVLKTPFVNYYATITTNPLTTLALTLAKECAAQYVHYEEFIVSNDVFCTCTPPQACS